MKKRMYLHIGSGKTGTSSIQNMLFSNTEIGKNDYLYPKTGLRGSGHHLLAHVKDNIINDFYINLIQNLKKEISESSCNNIIISSEFFMYIKDIHLKYFFDNLNSLVDFTIIFYVRDQVKLITSTFLHWQKVGHDYENINKFFTKRVNAFDFNHKIQLWEKYFEKKNIRVTLFDKKIIGNDVCKDFLSRINFRHTIPLSSDQSNISLIPEFSNLITLLDSNKLDTSIRKKIMANLLDLSVQMKTCSKAELIDDDIKKKIYDQYKVSNAKFASKYLTEEEKNILCSINTSAK